MTIDLKAILKRIDPYCTKCMEAAAGLCVNRSNYEVAVEHMLLQLLEDEHTDVALVLQHFEIESSRWRKALIQQIERLKDGNPGRPVFSPHLSRWLEDAWFISSLDLEQAQIRSLALLIALVEQPERYGVEYLEGLEKLTRQDILRVRDDVLTVSQEQSTGLGGLPSGAASPGYGPSPGAREQGREDMLARFTIDFTQRAQAGEIDPVFGRDQEIRLMVDVLARRRKNNPIVVGEAGVGKTAVVEGLALRIAEGNVPDVLKGVRLISLDLGLLQAGASVKGEFENRLKGVITEVKSSPVPIVLFIDEAHALIGAGGVAGMSDAANLLKPALARGDLRTIAATTWSEYKKYFEKDAALARRFQLIKLDEPTVEDTVMILRGLVDKYETAHHVHVTDRALQAAAELSARYLSGRQLPDKAVDVLDTACARVKVALSEPPANLQDLWRRKREVSREREALLREARYAGAENPEVCVATQDEQIKLLDFQINELESRWEKEQASIRELQELRAKIDESANPTAYQESAKATIAVKDRIRVAAQDRRPMIPYEVTEDVVAQIISDWTGVPLGDMLKDEVNAVLTLGSRLKGWVKGQDHALDAIDAGIRAAKADVQDPGRPIGVFLLVGPSGVGKTETALGVANLLFGGDQFLVTLNMSEFQEKHTVSRLVGSPPGYVGYGEGGILTEAVRQRPYSVVLLDEVEKADRQVLNIFYQVFDKGMLADGEGRSIDFRNTVIFMTSNLGSETIMQLCADGNRPDASTLIEALRPQLQHYFNPALLARMQIIPYYPVDEDTLRAIARVKLDKVKKRVEKNHNLEFGYTDALLDQIVARCTDVESGARNIDHIINGTILPNLATNILARVGSGESLMGITLDIGADGRTVCKFNAEKEEEHAVML